MEVKLGTHMCSIVSMTTTNKKLPQAIFFKITSSLLKLAQYSTHGGETWYACVFNRFHDNHQQKIASGTFLYSIFKLTNGSMYGDETNTHVYFIFSMTTTYKKEWRQVNKKSNGLKKKGIWDWYKRKGDKIVVS